MDKKLKEPKSSTTRSKDAKKAEDLKEYRKAVNSLATNKVGDIIFNHGDDHALIIFENIFKSANKELRILANSLNNPVTDNSTYTISLLSFLIFKKGNLKIIVSDAAKFKKSILFDTLQGFKENVEIRETDTVYSLDSGSVHFCIGDSDMYRLEMDTESRKAQCSFNDPTGAKHLTTLFDTCFNSASLVSF